MFTHVYPYRAINMVRTHKKTRFFNAKPHKYSIYQYFTKYLLCIFLHFNNVFLGNYKAVFVQKQCFFVIFFTNNHIEKHSNVTLNVTLNF